MNTNTPTLPVKRVFNAITGAEVVEIILKESREQLEANDNLQPHITYPILEFFGRFGFRAYPRTPETFDVNVTGRVVQHERQIAPESGATTEAPAFTMKELGEPVVVKGESELSVDGDNPPDKAREDHGLPVPMPEKSETQRGAVVDKPRIRPKGSHHGVGERD